MYIIVECYYNHGESSIEKVEEKNIRNYCLTKIIEYGNDLGFDNKLSKTDSENLKCYNHALMEIKSTIEGHYTLDRLVEILIDMGNMMINEQLDYGIRYIIKGENIKVFE